MPHLPGECKERFVLVVLPRVHQHPLHRTRCFQAHRRTQHVEEVRVHVRRLLGCFRRFRRRPRRFGCVGDYGSSGSSPRKRPEISPEIHVPPGTEIAETDWNVEATQ